MAVTPEMIQQASKLRNRELIAFGSRIVREINAKKVKSLDDLKTKYMVRHTWGSGRPDITGALKAADEIFGR